MTPTGKYNAVPFMFTVAPIGSTKRDTRVSILLLTSRHLMVTGSVAELQRIIESFVEEDVTENELLP